VSDYLGIREYNLKQVSAYHTAKEIASQPELWLNLWKSAQGVIPELKKYLRKVYSQQDINIILTGAGTSAFIGDVLAGTIEKETGIFTKAVATTDLVTHPDLYFHKNKTVLLISFARSGNSPESSHVIELSEHFAKKVFHLIITCNNKSELLLHIKDRENFIFYMPPEADDQSLAMTASFTSMLLAGLIFTHINNVKSLEENITLITQYGSNVLTGYTDYLKAVAELKFNRAVFLGSGMMKGVARESHLKLQELTDGKVICKYDSFLGLRHGPKVVIDERTIIIPLFSNNEYVNKYEFDLINTIKDGRKNLYSIGVMESDLNLDLDLKIILSKNLVKVDEDFLPVVSVLPAQILGFFKSLDLGLKPDSPSNNGMIHRVVQGVKIYPYD